MRSFNSVTRQRGHGIGGIYKGFYRTYAPVIKEEPDEEMKEVENEEQVMNTEVDPDQWLSFKPKKKRRRMHQYVRREEQ